MMLAFDYADADRQAFALSHFEGAWDGGSFTVLQGDWIHLPDTWPGYTTYRIPLPFTTGSHTVAIRACNATGCGPTVTFAVSPAPPTGLRVVR
jgi:hypothetical protein